jgi:hypothetical protein
MTTEQPTKARDVLRVISLIRTAIDDPKALYDPPARHGDAGDPTSIDDYIRDRCDEAIGLLDVELRPAIALETCGRLIAEVVAALVATEHTELGDDLHDALDVVDAAAEYLRTHPEALS